MTEAGQHYYKHCRAILIEAEAAQDSITALQSVPCGTIRVTCPIGLLNFHVAAMLAEFMLVHPQVTVHLEATNRRVDVLGEGVDIALRVRPMPLEDSELALRVLSDRGQALVAAPALLNTHGTPDEPTLLATLPSMSRSSEAGPHYWQLSNSDGAEIIVKHAPRYTTTDMFALKAAAVAGAGIVQLPILMLTNEIADGSLVTLLPEWTPRREIIHLVFPSRRGLLPAVRALIDFLVEKYASFEEA